jgi:hypothetical protein
MNLNNVSLPTVLCIAAFAPSISFGYEIGNHASMSEQALRKSVLVTDVDKLRRLGLKALLPDNTRQLFPRNPLGTPEKQCYGYVVDNPLDPKASWTFRKDEPSAVEPFDLLGSTSTGNNGYTLIDLIRYGSCYEDSEDPGYRSLAHFYDPQNGVSGISSAASPDWVLSGATSAGTGPNHFTYNDARSFFYKALTLPGKTDRDKNWGQTFQTLGHVVHHLQDMGSPQHTRSDSHCDAKLCAILGQYKPSVYEKGFGQRLDFIRGLASLATTPILFGLPREFWSNGLTVNGYQSQTDGIAGYSSTQFVSVRTDYLNGLLAIQPNLNLFGGHSLPAPAQTPFETLSFAALKPGITPPAVLCNDPTKCSISFYGSTQQPNSRKSSKSIWNQDLTAQGGNANGFTQNQFTYEAAVNDLVPLATRYSAGLIDYFFRGELAIRVPAEGMYGLIDGGNPASNCKDSCGFPKLKLRVRNTTAAINGVPQNMVGGTLVGVVKYSRNSCYAPNWSGDFGELNTTFDGSTCLGGNNGDPVEEQIVSAPVSTSFSLAADAEQQITLDFSTKPLPVNAWNIKLQLVYQGALGAEPNAVVVTTKLLSAPAVYRALNETNYLLINQRLYTRDQVNADQTLLTQVDPPSCVVGAAGSRRLSATCALEKTIATSWQAPSGQTLATLSALPLGRQAVLLMLGNSGETVSGTAVGLDGAALGVSVFARAFYFSDAINSATANGLSAYRGLQSSFSFYNVYNASVDVTDPPFTEAANRPALQNPTPVPMTSINF